MSSIGLLGLLYSITPSATTPASLQTLHENEPTTSQASSQGDAAVTSSDPSDHKLTRSASRPTSRQGGAPRLRNRSYSYASNPLMSPRVVLSRIFFGPQKTKRSLSEEAENGDCESVCSWIRDGTDPNAYDSYGYTPLLNASALGRVETILQLLKNGADVNKSGPFGFTPLHAAAQNGHREAVAVLLAAGADINAQNDDMDTAMHLALRSNFIEIVYLLIRNGGNSKLEGFQHKDCVRVAKECGLIDLSNSLKNYRCSGSAIGGYHPHSSMTVSTAPRTVM